MLENTCREILFILSIYSDGLSVDQLLFHLKPGEAAGSGNFAGTEKVLWAMEEEALICICGRQRNLFVRPTAFGLLVANHLADALADSMVTRWRIGKSAQSASLPAHAGRAS